MNEAAGNSSAGAASRDQHVSISASDAPQRRVLTAMELDTIHRQGY